MCVVFSRWTAEQGKSVQGTMFSQACRDALSYGVDADL